MIDRTGTAIDNLASENTPANNWIPQNYSPPPETTVASSPPETTAAPQEPESSGLTTEHKIIIGVCVSVFALAVIAVVAVKMYQQKKRRNQTSETQAK
uniref:Uncharacterized protein n=1 Tax=Magallana gigas TaxID=29159 RepID=K1Q7M0_MAGGI